MLPAQSIVEGMWVDVPGQAAPVEWTDFMVMKEMHWSWADLQETPLYVVRYVADFLSMISERKQQLEEQANRG